jgi:putative acetyltransferase
MHLVLSHGLPYTLGLNHRYEKDIMLIRRDDLASEASRNLICLHLEGMHANSPPGSVFALDYAELLDPAVTVWSAWQGDAILGICALKEVNSRAGEVKSMRTHPEHLRKGVARALLEHLIAEARRRGYTLLSLETGSGPAFDAALTLYRARGFVNGEAFGNYVKTDFNQFLHLQLANG